MYTIKVFQLGALICAFVFSCPSFAQSPINITAPQTKAMKNASIPMPGMIIGGQPSQEALATLAKQGVKHVINLRGEGEQDWDEAAYVQSLGMQYHALPIKGAAGVNDGNARALANLLSSIEGEPTLLHCASGNRVGGLIALDASMNQSAINDAIKKGKLWGMTGLESHVRETIIKRTSEALQ